MDVNPGNSTFDFHDLFHFVEMKYLLYFLFILSIFIQCKTSPHYDVVLTNATILDVTNGNQLHGKTIGVSDGMIQKIADGRLEGMQTIDVKNRLITPTFIDAHIHPISEFSDGDYDVVPDTIPQDSSEYYRSLISDAYLQYGTSTVLMMGHPDAWTDEFLAWSAHPTVDHVDVYTCGGALATEDGHTYPGHLRVLNPEIAKQQIIEYHNKGLKHLKLYWRLKQPEFDAIVRTADSLDIKTFSHAGGFFDPTQLTIAQAIELGVKDFEHIAILPCSVFDNNDWAIIHEEYQNNFREVEGEPDQVSLLYILETFRHVEKLKKDKLIQLIDKMAKEECSISTTIGWIYKTYHETFFAPAKIQLNEEQYARCHENFALFMDYVNLIHQKGIPIRIGTDTKPGGKLVLLEIMLMVEYGMPIEEALKIATINGANALGLSNTLGTIEENKQANFIIWDKNPLEDVQNILAEKVIFKEGKEYKSHK